MLKKKTKEEKEIEDLKKQVKLLQKQLATVARNMAAMDKKLNRTYHAQHATAAQVHTLVARISRKQ